jgi:histidine phosphotransfer protein HptB
MLRRATSAATFLGFIISCKSLIGFLDCIHGNLASSKLKTSLVNCCKAFTYMNHQSESPINLEQLNQISEGDIEFEIEVLQVYVEDISQRLNKIRDEIVSNQWSQIMGEAHHLKGSSSNVGAYQIQILALQIEELNHSQDSEKALEIIDEMFLKLKAVELFITEKLATLPS